MDQPSGRFPRLCGPGRRLDNGAPSPRHVGEAVGVVVRPPPAPTRKGHAFGLDPGRTLSSPSDTVRRGALPAWLARPGALHRVGAVPRRAPNTRKLNSVPTSPSGRTPMAGEWARYETIGRRRPHPCTRGLALRPTTALL